MDIFHALCEFGKYAVFIQRCPPLPAITPAATP